MQRSLKWIEDAEAARVLTEASVEREPLYRTPFALLGLLAGSVFCLVCFC